MVANLSVIRKGVLAVIGKRGRAQFLLIYGYSIGMCMYDPLLL